MKNIILRQAGCISLVVGMSFIGSTLSTSAARAEESAKVDSEHEGDILTNDFFVPHVSTIPGLVGEPMRLFVREKIRREDDNSQHHTKPVVLMIHGGTQASVSAFDVPFEDYNGIQPLPVGSRLQR